MGGSLKVGFAVCSNKTKTSRTLARELRFKNQRVSRLTRAAFLRLTLGYLALGVKNQSVSKLVQTGLWTGQFDAGAANSRFATPDEAAMIANQSVEAHANSRKIPSYVRRKLTYNRGPRVEAMLDNMAESRCDGQARNLLDRIGEYLVDHYLDGIISKQQLRSLRKNNSDNRTLWRHVNLLVQVGVLIPLEGGQAYELAHFLEHNYHTTRRAIVEAGRGRGGAIEPAASFQKNGQVDVKTTVKRPLPDKESPKKSSTYAVPGRQLTEQTKSTPVFSRTHNQAPKQTANGSESASNVPSLVDSKEKPPLTKSRAISPIKSSVSDEEWTSMLAAFASRGETADQQMSGESRPDPEGEIEATGPLAEDSQNYEPARMPADESPATEHSCLEALKKLRGGDPERQEVDYLRKLMCQLKARDVELGYAVNRTAAKLEKGGSVYHMTHWLTGIIEEQRSHWRRKIEDEDWEVPRHLASFGEPCSWPVRASPRLKHWTKSPAWRLAS